MTTYIDMRIHDRQNKIKTYLVLTCGSYITSAQPAGIIIVEESYAYYATSTLTNYQYQYQLYYMIVMM